MTTTNFFNESSEQSTVKAQIVSKYFWAWAKVIMPSAKKGSGKIAYIDLFAGPGRYKDGTTSTPLLILEKAIQDPDMSRMLVALFNDRDTANVQSLENAIKELDGIEQLKHLPVVYNEEVGEKIAKMFEEMKLVPTLFFVDPWGYKGLSLRLVNAVLKHWGCDCIFFFNYTRINMGLSNEAVREHMDALFGTERANLLRQKLEELPPAERETAIVEELGQALQELGGKYVLPFCFKKSDGARTSHHLIFVSKHVRGYEIMKGIMAKESSSREQGVPTFEYSPASSKYPMLFELSRPLDDLAEQLLKTFAGRTVSMRDIYEQHNVGTRYIEPNYKEILKKLEADGKIIVNPSFEKRRPDTFGPNVKVTFPERE